MTANLFKSKRDPVADEEEPNPFLERIEVPPTKVSRRWLWFPFVCVAAVSVVGWRHEANLHRWQAATNYLFEDRTIAMQFSGPRGTGSAIHQGSCYRVDDTLGSFRTDGTISSALYGHLWQYGRDVAQSWGHLKMSFHAPPLDYLAQLAHCLKTNEVTFGSAEIDGVVVPTMTFADGPESEGTKESFERRELVAYLDPDKDRIFRIDHVSIPRPRIHFKQGFWDNQQIWISTMDRKFPPSEFLPPRGAINNAITANGEIQLLFRKLATAHVGGTDVSLAGVFYDGIDIGVAWRGVRGDLTQRAPFSIPQLPKLDVHNFRAAYFPTGKGKAGLILPCESGIANGPVPAFVDVRIPVFAQDQKAQQGANLPNRARLVGYAIFHHIPVNRCSVSLIEEFGPVPHAGALLGNFS